MRDQKYMSQRAALWEVSDILTRQFDQMDPNALPSRISLAAAGAGDLFDQKKVEEALTKMEEIRSILITFHVEGWDKLRAAEQPPEKKAAKKTAAKKTAKKNPPAPAKKGK